MPIEPRVFGLAGDRIGRVRLFEERKDAVIVAGLHDSELLDVDERYRDTTDRDVRVPLPVGADHASIVHLVDVIAGQNEDVFGVLAFE